MTDAVFYTKLYERAKHDAEHRGRTEDVVAVAEQVEQATVVIRHRIAIEKPLDGGVAMQNELTGLLELRERIRRETNV